MSLPPVSIIGAGIGGLTLSRCLLKRGIPSVLYERARPSATRHGYGITLHPSAYRPLLKVLDLDETTFKQRVAVDGPVGRAGAIDLKKLSWHDTAPTAIPFRAHRGKLETLLGEGLDIRWNSALDKLELSPSGPVLHLQDGQCIPHPVVVGADGVHSPSRKSLLPHTHPIVLPFVAFNGKRSISKSDFSSIYGRVLSNSTILGKRCNAALLHISIHDYNPFSDSVNISWTYSRAAQVDFTDPLYAPNRPAADATFIPDAFYREVASLPPDLPLPFAEVFSTPDLRTDRTLSWLMRTVLVSRMDLQRLAESCVFFVGDAAHAQPILGGEGANEAIRDGVEMAECVAEDGWGAVDGWYEARYERWVEGVERSERALREMHA